MGIDFERVATVRYVTIYVTIYVTRIIICDFGDCMTKEQGYRCLLRQLNGASDEQVQDLGEQFRNQNCKAWLRKSAFARSRSRR